MTQSYEIRIDALAALDYVQLDALADVIERDPTALDVLAPTALIALAAVVGVTSTNVALAADADARFSHADVALTFDATPDDVSRYVTAYDLDADAVSPRA